MSIVVRDCLGRERVPEKVYPDGGYNCPFCGYAVPGTQKGCPNPACFARVDPPYPKELAKERLAASERAARAEANRKRDHETAMRRGQEQKREQNEWVASQIAEAEKRGACTNYRCVFPRGSYDVTFRHSKFTKHRGVCPKASK